MKKLTYRIAQVIVLLALSLCTWILLASVGLAAENTAPKLSFRDLYDRSAQKIEPSLRLLSCDSFVASKKNDIAYACLLDDRSSVLWISARGGRVSYATLISPGDTMEQRDRGIRAGAVLIVLARGGGHTEGSTGSGFAGNHIGLSFDMAAKSFNSEGAKQCIHLEQPALSESALSLCLTMPDNAVFVWVLSATPDIGHG